MGVCLCLLVVVHQHWDFISATVHFKRYLAIHGNQEHRRQLRLQTAWSPDRVPDSVLLDKCARVLRRDHDRRTRLQHFDCVGVSEAPATDSLHQQAIQFRLDRQLDAVRCRLHVVALLLWLADHADTVDPHLLLLLLVLVFGSQRPLRFGSLPASQLAQLADRKKGKGDQATTDEVQGRAYEYYDRGH